MPTLKIIFILSLTLINSACITHRVDLVTPHNDHLDLVTTTTSKYLFFGKNVKQSMMRCKEEKHIKSGRPVLKCHKTTVIFDGKIWEQSNSQK